MSEARVMEEFKEFAWKWFQKGIQTAFGHRGDDKDLDFETQWEEETFDINITEHNIIPNQQVIEIIDDNGLVATVIPKKNEIAILTKWFKGVDVDETYPPKITIKIDRGFK